VLRRPQGKKLSDASAREISALKGEVQALKAELQASEARKEGKKDVSDQLAAKWVRGVCGACA